MYIQNQNETFSVHVLPSLGFITVFLTCVRFCMNRGMLFSISYISSTYMITRSQTCTIILHWTMLLHWTHKFSHIKNVFCANTESKNLNTDFAMILTGIWQANTFTTVAQCQCSVCSH